MRTLAALLFISTAVFAQSDCSLSGAVVNSVTHIPVIRARLSIATTNETISADSDQLGKWRVEHLACGKVTITATRPGFLRLEQRADAPSADLKIDLIPQAVVTGRVMDELSDPIPNSHVSLMDVRIIDGERGIQVRDLADANDLGEFRFSGLQKGRYVVCASVSPGSAIEGARRYGGKCSPGAMDSGMAGAAEIVAGEEHRIDFVLPLLPTVGVSGVVVGLSERTLSTIYLASQAQISGAINEFSTRSKVDGTFSIHGVPAGSYKLTASTDASSASIPVAVGNVDLTDLRIRIEPPVRITVKIDIDVESVSGKRPDRMENIVFLQGGAPAEVDQNGDVSIADVAPGTYRANFFPPSPFYVKSATLAGRNIRGEMLTVQPGMDRIEVTLRDDGGTIEGDVSADDLPASAWVLLQKEGVPTRNAQADGKGHFKIDAVPPGDYKVYAWDDNANVEYRNPAWMQRYGKPAAVSVAPNQTAHVNLVRQIAPE